MVTSTTPRSRRHAATRDEIVAAAWRLATRDGIAAISLRDLAAEVGMRAPSLYTYFTGKDALYDTMFTEGYATMARDSAGIASTTADLDRRDAMVAMATWFVRWCAADVPRYQLLFTRAIAGWEASTEALASSARVYAQMATHLDDLGIRSPQALDAWTAVTAGLAAQQVANDLGGERWIAITPHLVDGFLATDLVATD